MAGHSLRLILFIVGSTAAFLAGGASAIAAPTEARPIERVLVNGYEVLLVHAPGAVAARVEAFVPTGALFDEPNRYAGRSHLWEHVIHRGSGRYPSMPIYRDAIAGAGGVWNAATYSNQIRYYAQGPTENWARLADPVASLVTDPLFDEAGFVPERSTVMGEAASVQGQDEVAIADVLRLQLRPDGHPWRMYHVGTRAQLAAMEMDDLRRLFYAEYAPGRMVFVVSGDFTNPALAGDQVVEKLGGMIRPFAPPPRFRNLPHSGTQRFPEFARRPANAEGRAPFAVEIESKERLRLLRMEFDASSDRLIALRPAVDLLFAYLNSAADGSLKQNLRESGLISDMGAWPEVFNNRVVTALQLELSSVAVERRAELAERVFAYLGAIARSGLPTETLEFLKSADLARGEMHLRSNPAAVSGQILDRLSRGESAARVAERGLELDAARGVTNEQIAEAARLLLNPEIVNMATIAPELGAGGFPQQDETFARGTRLIDSPAVMGAWRAAFASGASRFGPAALDLRIARVPNVSLATDEPPPTAEARQGSLALPVPARRLVDEPGQKAIIEVATGALASVARLSLRLRLLEPAEIAALTIWSSAFGHERASQMAYLEAAGVKAQMGFDGRALTIQTEGAPEKSLTALRWLMAEWASYRPTPEALTRAFDVAIQGARAADGDFSARLAERLARRILRRDGTRFLAAMQWLQRAERERPGTAAEMVARAFARSDSALAMYGDWNERQARALLAEARGRWPQALRPAERAAVEASTLTIAQTTTFEGRMPGNRNPGDFSHARTWTFGGLDAADAPEQAATFRSLVALLQRMTFDVNRTRKGLGYVHGAAGDRVSDLVITLFGETDGDGSRSREIEAGFNEVLGVLASREPPSPAQLALFDSVRSAQATKYARALLPADQLNQLMSRLMKGRPLDWNVEMARAASTLTYEDVRVLARQVFAESQPYLDVRLHGPGYRSMTCDAFLASPPVSSMDGARRSLRGN